MSNINSNNPTNQQGADNNRNARQGGREGSPVRGNPGQMPQGAEEARLRAVQDAMNNLGLAERPDRQLVAPVGQGQLGQAAIQAAPPALGAAQQAGMQAEMQVAIQVTMQVTMQARAMHARMQERILRRQETRCSVSIEDNVLHSARESVMYRYIISKEHLLDIYYMSIRIINNTH